MSDTPSREEAFAAMSAPAQAHKKLAPLAGNFKAEVRVDTGEDTPMVSTGSMQAVWDLGGRFLKQVFVGDPIEGASSVFEGRGYLGYNKSRERYESFWIDNASTVMQLETGDVDSSGRVWTLSGEILNPHSGEPVEKTSRITVVDNDHHTLEVFFGDGDGDASVRSIEIRYARA